MTALYVALCSAMVVAGATAALLVLRVLWAAGTRARR